MDCLQLLRMHNWTCTQRPQTTEQHNMPKSSLVNFLRTRPSKHVPANGQYRCWALIFDRFSALLKIEINSRVHRIETSAPSQIREEGWNLRCFGTRSCMRPNTRVWRGQEGESAREDVLCICTLHVPTHERGGCVEGKGGIERASNRFRGDRNFGPEAGFNHVQVPNQGPEEQWNHEEGRDGRRVQLGRCPSRHSVNCGCRLWILIQGELSRGSVKISKWHLSETQFWLALFWARKGA